MLQILVSVHSGSNKDYMFLMSTVDSTILCFFVQKLVCSNNVNN